MQHPLHLVIDNLLLPIKTLKGRQSICTDSKYEITFYEPIKTTLNQLAAIQYNDQILFQGIITSLVSSKKIKMHSLLFDLNFNLQKKTFSNQSIKTIVQAILSKYQTIDYEFHSYKKIFQKTIKYILQYDETDLDFLTRLSSNCQFYWYFNEKLIFTDKLETDTVILQYKKDFHCFNIFYQRNKTLLKIVTRKCKYRLAQCVSIKGHPYKAMNSQFVIIDLSHHYSSSENKIEILLSPFNQEKTHQIKHISMIEQGQTTKPHDPSEKYHFQYAFDKEVSHIGEKIQIFTGRDYGVHIPFRPKTNILIENSKDAQQKPFILGALNNENCIDSSMKFIINTFKNNYILFSYNKHIKKILFHTNYNTITCSTENPFTKIQSKKGPFSIQSYGSCFLSAQKNQMLHAGNNFKALTNKNFKIQTAKSNILFKSNSQLIFQSEHTIKILSEKHFTLKTKSMCWHSSDNIRINAFSGPLELYTKDTIQCHINNNICLQSDLDTSIVISWGENKIQLSAEGDIIIETSKLSINTLNVSTFSSQIHYLNT